MDIRKTIGKVLAASDRFIGRDPLDRHNWYGGHQLHKPERLDGETREQYQARRRRSASVVKAMQRPPHQEPTKNALDFRRFWLGQHTNPGGRTRRQDNLEWGARQTIKRRKAWRRGEDYQPVPRDDGQHPDHSALRCQEAKAARGRKARQKRAEGLA